MRRNYVHGFHTNNSVRMENCLTNDTYKHYYKYLKQTKTEQLVNKFGIQNSYKYCSKNKTQYMLTNMDKYRKKNKPKYSRKIDITII